MVPSDRLVTIELEILEINDRAAYARGVTLGRRPPHLPGEPPRGAELQCPATSSEQAVRITYQLSGDGYGDPDERAAILDLKYRLIDAVEATEAGEVDGTEFGAGKAEIFTYGPDARRLFAVMESELRAFPNRPALALLRFGEPDDPSAAEERIEL